MIPWINTLAPDEMASLFGVVLSIVAGGWVFYKFILQKEFFARVEFNVDVIFIVEHKSQWIVEILCVIENKGLVRHRVPGLRFTLRGLRKDDDLRDGGEDINFQTRFPHMIKNGEWIPKSWKSTFIEPGTTQRYRYIARVPEGMSALLLHGRMNYRLWRVFHTANKLIRVPAAGGCLVAGAKDLRDVSEAR